MDFEAFVFDTLDSPTPESANADNLPVAEASVAVREPMGSDLYLTVDVEGNNVMVRTRPDSRLDRGRPGLVLRSGEDTFVRWVDLGGSVARFIIAYQYCLVDLKFLHSIQTRSDPFANALANYSDPSLKHLQKLGSYDLCFGTKIHR